MTILALFAVCAIALTFIDRLREANGHLTKAPIEDDERRDR